jgi:hypothetical protein
METAAFLLYPVAPMSFIQTPKEVLIMTQRKQELRHVYENAFHCEHVKPSLVEHLRNDPLIFNGFLPVFRQPWVGFANRCWRVTGAIADPARRF